MGECIEIGFHWWKLDANLCEIKWVVKIYIIRFFWQLVDSFLMSTESVLISGKLRGNQSLKFFFDNGHYQWVFSTFDVCWENITKPDLHLFGSQVHVLVRSVEPKPDIVFKFWKSEYEDFRSINFMLLYTFEWRTFG